MAIRDTGRSVGKLGVSASHSYDAAGQRTRSVVTSGGVTTTTTYTYEGLSLLSLAATQSTGTTYSVSYLYDGQGRPYAGVYASQGATPTLFQVVTTDRGDVVELLDTAGTAFAAYRYDSWGVPTETTSTAAGTITSAVAAAIASRQPLRYAGYAYDEHSGLYYLSARSYDPVTRQFLSKDPAKDDGEESAYQYCGGDPVGKVDPTGRWSWKLAAIIRIGPKKAAALNNDRKVREAARYALMTASFIASAHATGAAAVAFRVISGLNSGYSLGQFLRGYKEWNWDEGDKVAVWRSSAAIYKGAWALNSHHHEAHYVYEQHDVYRNNIYRRTLQYGRVDVRATKNGSVYKGNVNMKTSYRYIQTS